MIGTAITMQCMTEALGMALPYSSILMAQSEAKSDFARRTGTSVTFSAPAKSLTLEPRKGHDGPNIVETECGLLNAMGYPNPGIEAGLKEFGGWKRKEGLIISIVGKMGGISFFSLIVFASINRKKSCICDKTHICCPVIAYRVVSINKQRMRAFRDIQPSGRGYSDVFYTI
jgi:dihydroorotate dehydrogenase